MHMGRCQEMGELLDWLRAHNASRAGGSRTAGGAVRFYGLDLGSADASTPSLVRWARFVHVPRDPARRLPVCLRRVPGWVVQVLEQIENNILIRPLTLYCGPEPRSYRPINARDGGRNLTS